MKKDLFGFRTLDPSSLIKISGLSKRQVVLTDLAEPPTSRIFLSLVNFTDAYIFAIGGHRPKTFNQNQFSSVDLYNIETDTWQVAPPLNRARSSHSSCSIEETWIYTFCGFAKDVD